VTDWVPNYQYFVNLLPSLLSGVKNKELLVVGCGTGNEILAFQKLTNNWKITGIDPSPNMVFQAREKLKEYDEVQLIDGEVADLPSHHRFEAATLLLVLHFLEDNGAKLGLLKQIADHLAPDAPFVILDITGDTNQIAKNLDILKNMLPSHLEAEQVEVRIERIRKELFSISEERLAQLFEEASFERPTRFFQSSIYMGWLTYKISKS